jgi:N-acetyl-1-D-myo-inositol-2-amino-2-deoxy-alpha-D-glucopyranoside deacetylase
MTDERRLLAVLAHPDDETFGTGGTLALYAQRGVQVHLVCATAGEVGEAPPDLKGFASIGEMRKSELRCAAQTLGLAEVHFLGYRDSGMAGSSDNRHPQALAAAPAEHVARQVAALMRRIRPQVVITFDPIGGYRHPDHIAIHNATVAAFRMAGDASLDLDSLPPFSPQKLYFHTFGRRYLRFAVRVLPLLGRDPHHFGKNGDIDLTVLAVVDFPVHASISIRSVMDRKEQASACHSSQGGGRMLGPLTFLQRWLGVSEHFMRAVPIPAGRRRERDLFEGVV